MLSQILQSLSGHRVSEPAPAAVHLSVPDDDDAEDVWGEPKESQAASGFACIIDYLDSAGRPSCRRISLIRTEQAKGVDYVRAYCLERAGVRIFRLDRVTAIYDIDTGEQLDRVAVMASWQPQICHQQGLTWGLSVNARADLIAALIAVTFVARCDRDWHPLEAETIEPLIASFWLRWDVRSDPPVEEITAYAAKLRPDAEAFYGAILRGAENPQLKRLIAEFVQRMALADGRLASEEVYYLGKVLDLLG